jgi:hypothetical protein
MRRVLQGLVLLWSSVSIAVGVFYAVELAYIGKFKIRNAVLGTVDEREAREPGHPYEHAAWYPSFLRARDSMRQRFDPLRTWSTYPITSEFLNVDSTGVRVTVQPHPVLGPTVLMLGGSAMWGFTNRDSHTIPSLYAAALAARGIDVNIINLAQPGYIADQELATLHRELKHGRRPVLVILLDGLNDILTTLLHGEPGHVFLEPRFRHIFEVQSRRGLFRATLELGKHSEVVQRLVMWHRHTPTESFHQDAGACRHLGTQMERLHTSLIGLAQAWGFDFLMVQQPMHATTGKELTAFEARLIQSQPSRELICDCATAIDSAMAPHQDVNYLSFASAFDKWSHTVFLDRYGHLTEGANRELAVRLADATGPVLMRRLATLHAGPPGPADAPTNR